MQKGLALELESAFEARVVRTLQDVARAHGDRTIESMPKRIAEIVRRRGGRSSSYPQVLAKGKTGQRDTSAIHQKSSKAHTQHRSTC